MEVKVYAEPLTKEEKDDKEPDKWEIDCWVRTLVDAEEIRADPEKMKYVGPILEKKVAATKRAAVTSVDDLRKIAKEKGV